MEAEKGSGLESGPDPREAQYVAQIMEAMGVDDYEPQVVRQLMEFSHRYITGVLRDAQSYMEYAGHTELHLDDVTLAIQSRVNYSFTTPPQVSVCLLLLSHQQHLRCAFLSSLRRFHENLIPFSCHNVPI